MVRENRRLEPLTSPRYSMAQIFVLPIHCCSSTVKFTFNTRKDGSVECRILFCQKTSSGRLRAIVSPSKTLIYAGRESMSLGSHSVSINHTLNAKHLSSKDWVSYLLTKMNCQESSRRCKKRPCDRTWEMYCLQHMHPKTSLLPEGRCKLQQN